MARVQRSGYWPAPWSSRIALSRFATWANGSPFAVLRISAPSGAADLDLLLNSRTWTTRSTVNFSQSYPQYPWHRMQLNSMLGWFSNLPGPREKVAVNRWNRSSSWNSSWTQNLFHDNPAGSTLVGRVAFVNQAGTLMHMIQQETLNPKHHFWVLWRRFKSLLMNQCWKHWEKVVCQPQLQPKKFSALSHSWSAMVQWKGGLHERDTYALVDAYRNVRFDVNPKPWQNLHKIIRLQYSLLGTPRTMWIVFRIVRNMWRWKFILLQISKGVWELLLLPQVK